MKPTESFSCFNCGGQGGRYEEDGYDTCYTCCGTGKVSQALHEENQISVLTENFVSEIYNEMQAAKYLAETPEEQEERHEYEAEFRAEHSHEEQRYIREDRYIRDTADVRATILDIMKGLPPDVVASYNETFANAKHEASVKWQESMRKKYIPEMDCNPVIMGLAKTSCEEEIPF